MRSLFEVPCSRHLSPSLTLASALVGVELVADLALALEPTERVDALVLAAVELVRRALVELCRKGIRRGCKIAFKDNFQ